MLHRPTHGLWSHAGLFALTVVIYCSEYRLTSVLVNCNFYRFFFLGEIRSICNLKNSHLGMVSELHECFTSVFNKKNDAENAGWGLEGGAGDRNLMRMSV